MKAAAKRQFDEQIATMKQNEEAAGLWCVCGHSAPTHDVGYTCQSVACDCLNFRPSNAAAETAATGRTFKNPSTAHTSYCSFDCGEHGEPQPRTASEATARLDFHIAESLVPAQPRTSAILLIEEESGETIAEFPNSPRGLAEVERVIRAVNRDAAFEAMVEALTRIHEHVQASFVSDGKEFVDENDVLNWCDTALKLAEAQQ